MTSSKPRWQQNGRQGEAGVLPLLLKLLPLLLEGQLRHVTVWVAGEPCWWTDDSLSLPVRAVTLAVKETGK